MDTYLSRLQNTTVEAAGKGLSDRVSYHGSDDAVVHGDVRMPQLAEPLKVDYALHQSGSRWMLYDITIDNVSTIASYRDEFNKIMNDGGFPKLVDRLKHPPAAPPP